MIAQKWNDDWTVYKSPSIPSILPGFDPPVKGRRVCLPYDAMIHEAKTPNTKNAHQTGYYPGFQYVYSKTFVAPEDWKNRTVVVEFEGVYMNARVYVNGEYAGGYPNGYTNFYIDLSGFLRFGDNNVIQVVANNGAELNSRWYSGSGIYRDVNLFVGESLFIPPEGLCVTTPEADADCASVVVETALINGARLPRRIILETSVFDAEGKRVSGDWTPLTIYGGTQEKIHQRLLIKEPLLWSPDSPNLYACRVRLLEGEELVDETVASFGVRTLSLDAARGLRINGKTVKLRGGCIHHDNGVIGAATFAAAEERRCRILKEAGFNCIRSAHHPMSKAMLAACDRMGMLVIDELSDMWTRGKNANDYSCSFPEHWETDAERMVAKDQNHPCVIFYVTGNEIPESGTGRGALMQRTIAEKFRTLDHTRFVTCAISGILANTEHLIEFIRPESGEAEEPKPAGSDLENDILACMTGPEADRMAVSPHLSEVIREFAAPLDIAGYNYLTGRHEAEKEINPNRVVLGIETFPSHIVRLWDIVERNAHVIGDMAWTAWDYLGEAGMGMFFYDGRRGFYPNWPCTAAYAGDIDIIGTRRPLSYLRQIVYGLRQEPYIAVERVDRNGQKPNTTPWMWRDVIASWTWDGWEGKPARVIVMSAAREVELFLNGKSLGKRGAGKENAYQAEFELAYTPGELTAVGYDDGVKTGEYTLTSAGIPARVAAAADRSRLKADGEDLAFVTATLSDEAGRENLQAKRTVSVEVSGAGTLLGFGSANPETALSYDEMSWGTYDGRVLAVVRAGKRAGEIHIRFSMDGAADTTLTIGTENQ